MGKYLDMIEAISILFNIEMNRVLDSLKPDNLNSDTKFKIILDIHYQKIFEVDKLNEADTYLFHLVDKLPLLYNTGFDIYAKNIEPNDTNRKKLIVEIIPYAGKIIITFYNMKQEINELKFYEVLSDIFEKVYKSKYSYDVIMNNKNVNEDEFKIFIKFLQQYRTKINERLQYLKANDKYIKIVDNILAFINKEKSPSARHELKRTDNTSDSFAKTIHFNIQNYWFNLEELNNIEMFIEKFPFFIEENFVINVRFLQVIKAILSYDDPNDSVIVKFKYNIGEIDLIVCGKYLTDKIIKYQTTEEQINAILKHAEDIYDKIKPRIEFLKSNKNKGD